MKLITTPANKLSNDEFHALRRLTLGSQKGEMFDALEDWRYDYSTRVVRLFDDDERVLGWGLVHPYDYRGNKDFQVYVRASHRRRGYGRMIYQRALRVAGGRLSMVVHPHSHESTEYFNTVHYKPAGLPEYKFKD